MLLEINIVHTNARSISYKYLQTQTVTNNGQVQIAIHNTPTRSLQHTHCCIAFWYDIHPSHARINIHQLVTDAEQKKSMGMAHVYHTGAFSYAHTNNNYKR